MIVLPDEFVSIKLLLCWYSNSLYFRFELSYALLCIYSLQTENDFDYSSILAIPVTLHCSLDSTSRRKLGIVFVGLGYNMGSVFSLLVVIFSSSSLLIGIITVLEYSFVVMKSIVSAISIFFIYSIFKINFIPWTLKRYTISFLLCSSHFFYSHKCINLR